MSTLTDPIHDSVNSTLVVPSTSQHQSALGRYQVLSSSAGVRVSPLCLGAMSFGVAWGPMMGAVEEEQAFKLLDLYASEGGNFIDTANNYQDEQSELTIGKWMAKRGNRDLMFVATKFTFNYRVWEVGSGKSVNYGGNHKKSLHLSIHDSLRKLQTSYINLLYLHWWDWTTSIEEIMNSLHILVEQGKVLYLGISDAPAWVVSAANVYARASGKTPFSVYQGRWNVMLRDMERDIIPMARHFGMAICPWDVLGQGRLQSQEQLETRKKLGDKAAPSRSANQSDDERRMSKALEKVAAEHGNASVQQMALAYVRHKAHNVFPIVGGRKPEHLEDNIKALSISLTEKQIEFLESTRPFDIGFPLNLSGDDPKVTGAGNAIQESWARIAWKKDAKPMDYW